ncbi:hypothetical protein DITRI_Ditri17bG0115800 [Diplodiscus trichospermus]
MAPLLCLMLFLAMTGYSSASYCLCKDGVGDQALQKALDYACGAGADCTPIQQNGACYNPNTLKDHCSYAVNSYFQKKAQAGGSCDFSGTATINPNPPSMAQAQLRPHQQLELHLQLRQRGLHPQLQRPGLHPQLRQPEQPLGLHPRLQQLGFLPQLQPQGQGQPLGVQQFLVVAPPLAQVEQQQQASMIQVMLWLSSQPLTPFYLLSS